MIAYSPQKTELKIWLELAKDPNLRRYIQARILQEIFTGDNAAARLKAIELFDNFPVTASEDALADISTEELLEADRKLAAWLEQGGGDGEL